MRRYAHRFLSCPFADQILIAQTFVLLGFSRAAIRLVSFQRLERFFGLRGAEANDELAASELALVNRIARAIRAVSPRTPWESNCFPQALTAMCLLRRHRLRSTLYLGAAFAESKTELKAHAWVRCGDVALTGGETSDQFGTVASYA